MLQGLKQMESQSGRPIRAGLFIQPVEIISDLLKRLYTEFLAFLAGKSFRSAVPPIQFWFTLPATWSNPTRMRMLEAINGAGFLSRDVDTIYFITEAESAASYYVNTHSESFENFAAFFIQSANPSLAGQQLAFTAIRCGAADVDYKLYNILCRGLGQSVNELNEELRGPTGKLMRVIRRDKAKFERDPVTVPLQTVARNANPAVYDRRRSRFTFHPHDVQGAYRPVINVVLSTLLQQLNNMAISNPSAIKILLTGGLSKAFHVQEEVKNFMLRQDLAYSIYPVTEAVAHGAVWRDLFGGLNQSPKSPRNFGLVSRELPPLSPAERRPLQVPPIFGRPVWFLPKDKGFSVPHQGCLTVKICHGSNDPDIVTIAICENDASGDPPAQLDSRFKYPRELILILAGLFPLTQCDIRAACRTDRFLTLNFDGAALEYFWHQKVGDEVFYCLEVKVIWTIPASDGWITLHAFALGRRIGEVEVNMQNGF
ncbi:Hsp70 family protein [Aspergillus affinis]|uniref:Hsp70 family protein n=1 Tax=Aspergillus affinis TaxID=1070780 RepID=UPI0022FE1000|nr:uncharacterized protein KD926_006994 [Aspergillus affinis]KAI9045693.1 hypothetical protein KD926_006994 [Aspergillus affinis]